MPSASVAVARSRISTGESKNEIFYQNACFCHRIAHAPALCFRRRKARQKAEKIVLQTKTLKIVARQNLSGSADFEMELENTFINRGAEPIIVLQPYDEKAKKPLLYAGVALFAEESDMTGELPIYSSVVLPSIRDECEKEPDESTDRNAQPAGLTRILGKGDARVWRTTVEFRLEASGESRHSSNETTVKIRAAIENHGARRLLDVFQQFENRLES
jgi:hypothetical protein